MKLIKILSPLLIFFVFVQYSASQTVDEVIDKYVTAIGGIEKINSIKTLKVTGKFLNGSFEIPFVQTISRPDKTILEMTIQGMTMKQAYDGTTAWMINPFQGAKEPEKMTEEQTKSMREQAEFEGKLINYKEKGYTAELMGREDMEGSEVYKIKITDKDGDINYYYIDTQTNLLLKESTKRKIKEKEIAVDTYNGDYKPFEGLLIPTAMEIKTPAQGMESQKITIEAIEFNLSVDDAIFKMPETKQ